MNGTVLLFITLLLLLSDLLCSEKIGNVIAAVITCVATSMVFERLDDQTRDFRAVRQKRDEMVSSKNVSKNIYIK